MRRLKIWLTTIGTIIVLAPAFWSLYLVRDKLPVLGLVILCSVGILFVAGTLFLLSAGTILVLKMLFGVNFHDIGQFGTIAQRYRHMMQFQPVMVVNADTTKPKQIEQKKNVAPTIRYLLESGMLVAGQIILGFREDGSPRIGTFDELRTYAVGGTSRSGKTLGLFFLLLQFLISGIKVTICDAHYAKPSSLTKLMRPLASFVNFAGDRQGISNAVSTFGHEIKNRANGGSIEEPWVLVIDEWTECVVDQMLYRMVVSIVEELARAGAGFNMYIILAGQLWQPSRSGGRHISGSMHAKMCYRLDPSQSRHLLSSPYYSRTSQLDTGCIILLDTMGGYDELSMPYGDVRDAAYLAREFALYTIRQEDDTTQVSYEEPAKVETPDPTPVLSSPKTMLDLAFEHWELGNKSRGALAKAMSISPHSAQRLIDQLIGAGKI